MGRFEIDQEHLVADEGTLRSMFDEKTSLAALKVLPVLDRHAKEFIRRAPFLVLGTQDGTGRADVSPRGDPAGFVQIIDDTTLAIPDRTGNNRLDSLSNILANPSVGLLFVVPGFDDTLRVGGTAQITTDPAILAPMAVNGRVPKLAIVVSVTEVFLHCAKAFRRSRMWDPAYHQDRREMASLSKIILDQTTGAPGDDEMCRIDADLEEEYARTMY